MREFKDGDKVMYEADDGQLLGPFTVHIMGDDSVGLWYKSRPEQLGDGDNVHAIVGSAIISEGAYGVGFDVARIRAIH